MGTREKIRLLLVDDQPQVLRGLRMWLGLEADFDVVGSATQSLGLGELIDQLRPDIVLMDIEMPGADGIAVTAGLCERRPALRVVMLSMHDDPATRARAEVAGAAAFVAKHEAQSVLPGTIRSVAERGGWAACGGCAREGAV